MYKLCRIMLILSALLLCYAITVATLYFGALAIIGLTVAWLLTKRIGSPALTAFGTARWAEPDELRRAGMLSGRPGLIIGRLNGSYKQPISAGLRAVFDRRIDSAAACQSFLASFNPKWGGGPPLVKLCNSVHTAAFAPSGAGKGVSLVIPFLLNCPESCVVTDFKGELALATAKYRQDVFGHRIVILDPYKIVTTKPDSFCPISCIDRNSPTALDDCRDLAAALVVRTGEEKDPHFMDSAEAWIAAFTAAVVEYGDADDDRSLQSVRELQVDPSASEMAKKLLCESNGWGGKLQCLGKDLTHFRGDELGSVMTTASRCLRFLDTPAIDECTRSSSFDPKELVHGKMTIYLVLPPEHAEAQSPLLRMWIGAMLRTVVRNGLQEKNRVHFVLDEAASLGHLKELDQALDKYRGYGVRLNFIYQSLGQIKKCFPGQEQTFLSNVNQIFFGVNDWETADYVSKRLGDETIVVASGGTSSGDSSQYSNQGHSRGTSSNANDNWQQQSRRLLKPEEIMALPQRTAITFMQGMRPICTTLTRYYEDNGAARKSFLRPLFALVASVCFLVTSGMVALSVGTLGSQHHDLITQPASISTQQFNGNK